jgi:hypothetical protein
MLEGEHVPGLALTQDSTLTSVDGTETSGAMVWNVETDASMG